MLPEEMASAFSSGARTPLAPALPRRWRRRPCRACARCRSPFSARPAIGRRRPRAAVAAVAARGGGRPQRRRGRRRSPTSRARRTEPARGGSGRRRAPRRARRATCPPPSASGAASGADGCSAPPRAPRAAPAAAATASAAAAALREDVARVLHQRRVESADDADEPGADPHEPRPRPPDGCRTVTGVSAPSGCGRRRRRPVGAARRRRSARRRSPREPALGAPSLRSEVSSASRSESDSRSEPVIGGARRRARGAAETDMLRNYWRVLRPLRAILRHQAPGGGQTEERQVERLHLDGSRDWRRFLRQRRLLGAADAAATVHVGNFNLTLTLRRSTSRRSPSQRPTCRPASSTSCRRPSTFTPLHYLGDVTMRVRMPAPLFTLHDRRRARGEGGAAAGKTKRARRRQPHRHARDQPLLALERHYVRADHGVQMRFELTNKGSTAIEIGAWGAAMVFDTMAAKQRDLDGMAGGCSFVDPRSAARAAG